MLSNDKCRLYMIRFFINFMVICILGGLGYFIYWVIDWVISVSLKCFLQYCKCVLFSGNDICWNGFFKDQCRFDEKFLSIYLYVYIDIGIQ